MARGKVGNQAIIVREIGNNQINVTAFAAGASEILNNAARFFNDTPYNLDLVAIKLTSELSLLPLVTDSTEFHDVLSIVEVSRQAIIAQAEGIIANVRARASIFAGTVALGGKAAYSIDSGQMILGNFKDVITTLEVQETLFLHEQLLSMNSITNIAIAEALHHGFATLYFRVRSTGYARLK